MCKYRIRCDNCHNNFCTKCNVEPYHIGKTWREHRKFKKAKKCRFCGDIVRNRKDKSGPFKYICDKEECINMISCSWDKVLECGHPCKGFYGEMYCLPWLHPEWVEKDPDLTLNENDESFWSIWFISGLGDSPSIQLGWRHIFHVECITEKLRQKWAGPRITFLFKTCPSCKAEIEADHHPEIRRLLEEAYALEDDIKKKALERAKIEGLAKDPRLSKAGDEYYGDLEKYAMARLSYYTCFKWQNPYFGGLKDWGNMIEAAANFKPDELVCGKCSSQGLEGQIECKKHGQDYIEFKCRYCWSLSQWFCFGTTHFCDPWHRVAGNNKVKPCPGLGKWALKIPHTTNGSEFAMGCGLWRNSDVNDF